MAIEVRQVDGIAIVKPGEKYLDANVHEQLREQLGVQVESTPRIILDLADCQFMDSSGIGLVLAIYREAVDSGGAMCITNANGGPSDVFKLTRLHRLVPIHKTIEDSLAAMQG
jgi:anti-anti-sigma factor